MGRSTTHYADAKTNNALKKLHNKLRPAGTPVQRVEYIIELLLLRIFETKIKQDEDFKPLRKLFSTDYKWKNPKTGKEETNENRLFSYLTTVSNEQILAELNENFFPFYAHILVSARDVFEGNLPQKVQDQLVLIEEVFSNSNFTNNVNSGNLGEVINIVAHDIEEAVLLKTDFLGDAIEAALSETGGTKDMGLFRTPDHVRQFMTAMLEPTYDDVIFDPACGTSGFLYDAYEFVMERMEPEQKWPGTKAHSELQQWFENYFKANKLPYPSFEQSTQFYRNGVTGIEYLGMIRKMAAINFYIRGLNPDNIKQGDSLAKYNPVTDHESKSIILANPPFGAERDQEAYPDVWQEYSKESETTILFVKLMFEHLKVGGKCAVIVSEGFHTWDQFSAKALRKMLLEEAQLRAVISLPQGLFVSKTGQGPKTSILIFEKGGKTDWVWHYKITNDGYTMGTNRKEQKGNQLVECLTLWHEYVKHGKQPPETKHQFCLPAQWLKTLDPRIKEKIRTETRTEMLQKGAIEKAKKEADLDKKLKNKKITEAEKAQELQNFDHLLENRIQNEIEKRIDKARNFSFNLANYKSNLPENVRKELKTAHAINSEKDLEHLYNALNTQKLTKDKIALFQTLNFDNALETDLARAFLNNLDEETLQQQPALQAMKELLKSGAKFLNIKLGTIISLQNKFIVIDEENIYKRVTCKLKGKGIVVRDKVYGKDLKTKKQQIIKHNQLLVAEIDAKFGGYGIVPLEGENAIVSSHYYLYDIDETEILPAFLGIVLQSENVLHQVQSFVKGSTSYSAIRATDFLELEIPLPSLEEQNALVAQIEKQQAVIEGAEKVLGNWEMPSECFNDPQGKKPYIMSEVCKYTGGSQPAKEEFIHEPLEGYVRLVQIRDFKSDAHITYVRKDSVTKFFSEDDIMIARYGPPVFQILRGMSGAYNVALMKAIPNEELVLRDYWFYYLQNPVIQNFVIDSSQRTAGQSGVNLDLLYTFQVFLPSIEEQREIVAELDAQMAVLEGLRKMKAEAGEKIARILAEVWGTDAL